MILNHALKNYGKKIIEGNYIFLLITQAPPRTALTANNAKIGLPVAGIL